MVEFCKLQTCRRKHLIEYFGEAWEAENCGGCDVCATPRKEFDATEIAQKILSAIIRTGGRFGARYVTDVLRGANTKEVKNRGHDQLTVFGIAGDHSPEDLDQLIDGLVAKGLVGRESGRFPTLAATREGHDFIKNRRQLTLTRSERSSEDGEDAPELSAPDLPDNPPLFEKLRALRKILADERGVPAFVIFGDVSLRQMATHLPQSQETFSQISGVGRVKLKEFSEPFLQVIRDYATANELTGNSPTTSRRKAKGSNRQLGSTLDQTKNLVAQKHSISDIAAIRGINTSTIRNHIYQLVTGGEELDVAYLMPSPHRMEEIKSAFQQTGDTLLTPVRELLGESYSYDEIAVARIGLLQCGLLIIKGDSFVVKESLLDTGR